MALPSFLHHHGAPVPNSPFINAFCHHESLGGDAHSLWWPTRSKKLPDTILYFIPGNPGLVEFYIPFLSDIQEKHDSDTLAIFAHAHLGHTPGFPFSASHCGFDVQIENAVEAFDALVCEFPEAKVTVIAHSMGCWITLKLLERRSNAVHSVILMTPTIQHLADSPNGRMLSWVFNPLPRTIISSLAVLGRLIPTAVVKFFHGHWPEDQLPVLQKLIRSPQVLNACFTTAHDEMKMITEPMQELIDSHADRVRMYFADVDGWVGQNREVIVSRFKGPVDNIFLATNVPHAFCINHSKPAADQVVEWLSATL
ncbi:hypothetical protein BDZ89DRAFT_1020242 [Hymenopellis radicata]|nr:hypothetical protein BDZ89DRAFT_1020242 [Hymenopellis radicata]